MKRLILLGFLAISFSTSLFATSLPAPLFESFADGSFKADTKNSLAQTYFNQGMVFFYGFDYLEAIRSFEAAVTLDKSCTICQIGLALSLGSITNAFIKGDEIDRANKILAQIKTTDPVAQGLVAALRLRYENVTQSMSIMQIHENKKSHCAQGEIELPAKNKLAFSNALFALGQKFPHDLTIQALFAYSILGTENWDLYDSLLDIKPYTNMMINACKRILEVNPNHIGAIHYYIHATEWSAHRSDSLKYADHLPQLAPLAEHLVHMPTHIYLRLGDYNKAVNLNLKAVNAYKEYEAICNQQGFKPAINFLNQHNYNYLFAAAIVAGRADIAYQAAEDIRKETPLDWLNKGVFFQRFYALKFYSIAHFGIWEQLKPLEVPLQKYPYLQAMWAYANALHALALHHKNDFETFFQKFKKAVKENNSQAHYQKAFANNLAIANEVLLANKARLDSHWEQAIAHWYKATSLQKPAGDPPEWYFPTQLGLGYTFLDAQKPLQAILTFESSLESNPENGWALFGLAKAYGDLNQPEKAQEFLSRFKKAWHVQAIALPLQQGSDIFSSSG
jgi:tetratricopeptide (TPR) repeat protein